MEQDMNGNFFEMWLREYRTRLQDVAEHGCKMAATKGNGSSEDCPSTVSLEQNENSASTDDLLEQLRPTTHPQESFGHLLNYA